MGGEATIIIRNAKVEAFQLQFSLDNTLGDLKLELSRTYEGKPQSAEQTASAGSREEGCRFSFHTPGHA